MSDYISREATRPDAFCEGVSCQDCPFCKDPVQGGCRIDDFVKSIPAADVVEVRHGKWINERQEGLGSFSAECSLCGKRTLAYFHYFYCPNCGAKMDGGQDDGTA